jgi:HemY protein
MIRRLLPIVCFFVLTGLTVLGTTEILSRARMKELFIRLPEVPPLSRRSPALKEKIASEDAQVRLRLAEKGTSAHFAQAVGGLGQLYHANQFYDQALSCYRLALDFDPKSAMWLYLSAAIHQQRGETASMIGFLEQTLNLSGGYAPAVLKLADTFFKAGDIPKAGAYYERRLALAPGDPYALMGLARIALDSGQWDVAEARLQKAISANPQFGDAHRLMAQVHEHKGRRAEMQTSLDRAADCTRFRPAPDPWIDGLEELCYDPEQLLVLGSMALAQEDIPTAVNKHFSRALKIDPDNPSVHLALGQAWLLAGEWARARQYLSRALELNPASDQAYFQLGLILQNQNFLPEAEAMMKKALVYQPNNANVLNNLGVILLGQGRFDEAMVSFKKALDVYPEHINARYNLGLALGASGKGRDAVMQYLKVLELKPDWPLAAKSLAWILATDKDNALRNGSEALKWARVAFQGKYQADPEVLDTLAAAFAEDRQFAEAVHAALKALELAEAVGDKELIESISERLRLYKAGRPYRQ